jgi:hypothetical protein
MLTRKMMLGIVLILCTTFIIPVLATTYYVDPNGDNSADGQSWETAFATIQKGIDTANDDDIVEVNEGIYNEGVSCYVKSITICSINPYDPNVVAATIINGAGNAYAVTLCCSRTATIFSGFTVTGASRGFFCLANSNANINHCIIRNNNYAGVELYEGPATVENCIIKNNVNDGIYVW